MEGGDDAGLVGWGVGEDVVEFGEPFADGGDVEGGAGVRGELGVVVVEPVAGGEAAVEVFAQRATWSGRSGRGP